MAAEITNGNGLLEVISSTDDSRSPSLLEIPQPFEGNRSTEAFREFREFVLDYRDEIEANIGIEIDCVDLNDQNSIGCLLALIWPEHGENRMLFDAAVKIVGSIPPNVRFGDALELLFDELPQKRPVNVDHGHTLNQFSAELKLKLDDLLSAESVSRPVNRLRCEGGKSGRSILIITTFRSGSKGSTIDLVEYEPHGRRNTLESCDGRSLLRTRIFSRL